MVSAADRYGSNTHPADSIRNTLVRDGSPSSLALAFKSLFRRMREWGYRQSLYSYRLNGRHPVQLMASPDDPAPGSAVLGSALLGGQMNFEDESLNLDDDFWIMLLARSARFQDYAHSFHWLQDLAQVGDQVYAREIAEALTKSWLEIGQSWDDVSWQAETLARRIINWIAHAPTILSSDDLVYRSQILHALARQSRHLMRTATDAPDGLPQVYTASALTIAGLVLPGGLGWSERGAQLLERVLARYIRGDGGPASRNPSDAIRTMQILILVRDSYMETARDVPAFILTVLDRLGPFIRAIRHGDGTFAQFSGVSAEGGHGTDAVLAASGATGKPIENMPHSGYQRAVQGRTCLIVDCGPPPALHLSAKANAGTASLEMSSGHDRLLVNMGPAIATGDFKDLGMLSRTTAAHSTLNVGDRNTSVIREDGLIGKGVSSCTLTRNSLEDGTHLTVLHDGYLKRFGVDHKRNLFLRADGLRLTGQDVLEVSSPRKLGTAPAALRFHLHPGVKATQAPDRRVVLETKGSETWIFAADGGDVTIEDSLYLARPDTPAATKQIVVALHMATGENPTCDWAFEKLVE